MSSKAACSSGYRIEVDCFEVLEIPVGTVRVGEKWYSSCTPELINQKRQDVQGVLLFEISKCVRSWRAPQPWLNQQRLASDVAILIHRHIVETHT